MLTGRIQIGPYEVLAPLGAGAMGEVYRARDTRLGREVAVKILGEAVVGDAISIARFRQEARLAGALNHPNVLAVHDVGEYEGKPYLVSELLEGESLRERLSAGPLPVANALPVALQISQGLAAAHEKGIVHRDLKPENVFLTRDGRVKILDFGIAKLLAGREVTPSEGSPRTNTGGFVGTIPYMSPEQVRGHEVDARSDLFSLGCVIYEMISGRRPFTGRTAMEVGAAILHDEPLPLPPEVPERLARLVARCLEKRPEDRFQSARDLVFDLEQTSLGRPAGWTGTHLRRRAIVLGLLAVVWAGASFLYVHHVPTTRGQVPGAAAPSIAVLPFANLSADRDQEYFSDGVAEEIRIALAQIEGLRVVGRTSSISMKGKNEDLRSLGEKLGAAHLLEGSVRRSGSLVRITAQLVRVADGANLWSRQFDREVKDVFAVQDEIAAATVGALKVKLLQPATAKERRTSSVEAYNQYLLGRQFFLRNNLDSYRRAVQAYEKAVAADSGYAPAWAGLSLATFWVADSAETPAAATAGQNRALEAADKAIAIGRDLPDGYVARGFMRVPIQWDWKGARADFEHALALSPEDPDALAEYATVVLSPLNRLDEAVVALRKSAGFDPLNARTWSTLGNTLSMSGQRAEARKAFGRSLEISPEQSYTPYTLARTLLLDGVPAEALAVSQRSTDEVFRLTGAALAQRDLGHATDARDALDRLVSRFGDGAAYQIAQIYAWWGEEDRALDWLERAVEQHDGGLINVKVEPLLLKLRKNPRYKALLQKINLPPD